MADALERILELRAREPNMSMAAIARAVECNDTYVWRVLKCGASYDPDASLTTGQRIEKACGVLLKRLRQFHPEGHR